MPELTPAIDAYTDELAACAEPLTDQAVRAIRGLAPCQPGTAPRRITAAQAAPHAA